MYGAVCRRPAWPGFCSRHCVADGRGSLASKGSNGQIIVTFLYILAIHLCSNGSVNRTQEVDTQIKFQNKLIFSNKRDRRNQKPNLQNDSYDNDSYDKNLHTFLWYWFYYKSTFRYSVSRIGGIFSINYYLHKHTLFVTLRWIFQLNKIVQDVKNNYDHWVSLQSFVAFQCFNVCTCILIKLSPCFFGNKKC